MVNRSFDDNERRFDEDDLACSGISDDIRESDILPALLQRLWKEKKKILGNRVLDNESDMIDGDIDETLFFEPDTISVLLDLGR